MLLLRGCGVDLVKFGKLLLYFVVDLWIGCVGFGVLDWGFVGWIVGYVGWGVVFSVGIGLWLVGELVGYVDRWV